MGRSWKGETEGCMFVWICLGTCVVSACVCLGVMFGCYVLGVVRGVCVWRLAIVGDGQIVIAGDWWV